MNKYTIIRLIFYLSFINIKYILEKKILSCELSNIIRKSLIEENYYYKISITYKIIFH